MAEYVDRQKILAETCTGCPMRGSSGECHDADPCERLIEAFLSAPSANERGN